MYAKSLLLSAALFTLPAASAFAQSTADQPASSATDAAPQAGSSAAAPAAAGPIVPATLADLKPNAAVYDAAGGQVGTLEAVTSTGATVFTGTARAQIPVGSFSKNAQGLVIGMTKSQLEAAVAQASTAKK